MLNLLFYVSVLALSLGQFSSISKGEFSAFYFFDLLIGLFALFGCIYFFGVKRRFSLPVYLFVFIIFSIVGFISLVPQFFVLGTNEFLISFSYLVRWFTYLVSAIVVYNMYKEGLITLNHIVLTFLLSGLFVSILGFIQLIVLPDFETLDSSLGWDPHKNRLAGPFFDPNFTGGYLCLILSIAVGYLVKKFSNLSKIYKVFFVLSLLAIVSAIFLTFSRSSWAMFSIIVFIVGLFRSRLLLLLALVLAFSAYFAVPRVQTRISGITDPADSAHFRLVSWLNTWEVAKDNLLIGVGFNTYRYVQKEYGFFDAGSYGGHSGAGSDSSLLLVLATTGFAGFVIFTFGFVYPLWGFLKQTLKGNNMSVFLLGGFMGLLVHSQFVNSLFYPQLMFLWMIVVAIYSSS